MTVRNLGRLERARLSVVHKVLAWIMHRSPLRSGSRMDRVLFRFVNFIARGHLAGHPTIVHRIVRRTAPFLVPTLRGPVLTPTLMGFDLCVDATCGKQYWNLGAYESGTLDLIDRVVGRSEVFVDVGASVGQMSLFGSLRAGGEAVVLSFEPEPTRFGYLTEGIRQNGISNVRAFPIALSNSKGAALLRTDLVSPSMIDTAVSNSTQQIQTERLDDVLDRLNLTEVAMVKLDVEGAELAVLQGARRLLGGENPPVLCFEHGVRAAETAEVSRFILESNDYRIFRFSLGQNSPGLLVPLGDIAHAHPGENLVACTASHGSKLPETVSAFP